jgi:hypothetical protein
MSYSRSSTTRNLRLCSNTREIGVTFNRELPAGRCRCPVNRMAASVPTAAILSVSLADTAVGFGTRFLWRVGRS